MVGWVWTRRQYLGSRLSLRVRRAELAPSFTPVGELDGTVAVRQDLIPDRERKRRCVLSVDD